MVTQAARDVIAQAERLPPDERAMVVAAIGSPRQEVSDRIWQWVVAAFLAIMLAVVATLIAAFLLRNSLAGIEALTAIFTAALGFIAGLFAPSPATK